MHRSVRDFLFIVVGLLVSASLVWAGRGAAGRLAGDVAFLNTLGRSPARAHAMEHLMASSMRTSAARIAALLADGMEEGDAAAALAVAERLPGGLTDANIAAVVKLWKAAPAGGWTGIAKTLGVGADKVALAIERVAPPAARPATSSAASGATAAGAPSAAHKRTVPGLSPGRGDDEG